MKITIFGRPNCTFCEQAIQLCEQKGLEFDYLTVGEHITKEELIDKIHKVSGDDSIVVRSVPQIFTEVDSNEYYVEGGFQGLKAKLS